jgi:hypothetical protein
VLRTQSEFAEIRVPTKAEGMFWDCSGTNVQVPFTISYSPPLLKRAALKPESVPAVLKGKRVANTPTNVFCSYEEVGRDGRA